MYPGHSNNAERGLRLTEKPSTRLLVLTYCPCYLSKRYSLVQNARLVITNIFTYKANHSIYSEVRIFIFVIYNMVYMQVNDEENIWWRIYSGICAIKFLEFGQNIVDSISRSHEPCEFKNTLLLIEWSIHKIGTVKVGDSLKIRVLKCELTVASRIH